MPIARVVHNKSIFSGLANLIRGGKSKQLTPKQIKEKMKDLDIGGSFTHTYTVRGSSVTINGPSGGKSTVSIGSKGNSMVQQVSGASGMSISQSSSESGNQNVIQQSDGRVHQKTIISGNTVTTTYTRLS